MGSALAAVWASAGFDVILASRDAEKADRIVNAILSPQGYSGVMGEQLPALGTDTSRIKLVGASVASAVTDADVVVLAVPSTAAESVLDSMREHVVGHGKVFVDITNPYLLGGGSSSTEPAAVLHRDYLADPSTSWAVGYSNM
jgi:predicted dinucleotide-binding enzyme